MSDNQPNKTKQNKNSNKNGNKSPILKLLDTDYEKKICLLMFTKLKCNIIDLGKNHKETVDLKTEWELPVKKNDKLNTKDFCLQSPRTSLK